ncbi:MAG TPA: glycosyltransferase family 9 protein [Acidimicrobiales bacterium]
MRPPRALLCRLDNLGDVLLTGPAVRAVAERADVAFLCGPSGEAAARLLPGVDDVLTFDAPWVGYDAPAVETSALDELVEAVRAWRPDVAFVFTSSHQSPLPLALLLRIAGVPWIGATSIDYPGTLLDLRRMPDPSLHEAQQALALVEAAGFALDPCDDGALRVRRPLPDIPVLPDGYVVVHPGASVPARLLPLRLATASIEKITSLGWPVVLTGNREEATLTRCLARARPHVIDLAGTLDVPTLAAVLERATVVVAGNTGPAHLAAAVGTPVVSVFAPVVPPHRWRPWGVPHVVLGDHDVPCTGCRSRRCPYAEQRCISGVTGDDVAAGVQQLARRARPSWSRATRESTEAPR